MNNNLSDNLKKIRKDNNLSQEQLAEELDISSRKLSRLENDKNLERYDKFLQLVVTLELYKPVKEEVEVDS